MIRIDAELTPEKLRPQLERVFEISAGEVDSRFRGNDRQG